MRLRYRLRSRREADAPQQILKARVTAQAVIMRVNFEVPQLQVVRLVGFPQQVERRLFISQPDVLWLAPSG